MDIHVNLAYRVYLNLIKFLETREMVVVSGGTQTTKETPSTNKIMGQDDLVPILQRIGYIMIEAADIPTKDRIYPKDTHPETHKMKVRTFVVLIDQHSEYLSGAQKFNDLLNKVPGLHRSRPGPPENTDVLLVTYNILGTNIINKFKDFVTLGDTHVGYIRIISYKYSMFTSEKLKHTNVPKCRILKKDEEKQLLKELNITKIALARIKFSDPVAVWLGAEVGNIIEEDIPSEVTGIEKNYRLVRP